MGNLKKFVNNLDADQREDFTMMILPRITSELSRYHIPILRVHIGPSWSSRCDPQERVASCPGLTSAEARGPLYRGPRSHSREGRKQLCREVVSHTHAFFTSQPRRG